MPTKSVPLDALPPPTTPDPNHAHADCPACGQSEILLTKRGLLTKHNAPGSWRTGTDGIARPDVCLGSLTRPKCVEGG